MVGRFLLQPNLPNKLMLSVRASPTYVLHINNLHRYRTQGFELIKVHACLGFELTYLLKPWVACATEVRKQAKGELGTSFVNCMSSAALGKTLEDVRSHVGLVLCIIITQFQQCV